MKPIWFDEKRKRHEVIQLTGPMYWSYVEDEMGIQQGSTGNKSLSNATPNDDAFVPIPRSLLEDAV